MKTKRKTCYNDRSTGMRRGIMIKKFKLGIGMLVFFLAGFFVNTVFAGGSVEPGSLDDPVVTKSYVDEQIYKLTQYLEGLDPTASGSQTGGTVPIKVEELAPGDILVGKSGTEIIVRSGTVLTYGAGSNGIPDLTGGLDIAIGKVVQLNHLLLIPRDDGRGIKVSNYSKGNSHVMIRGEYQIIKASENQ